MTTTSRDLPVQIQLTTQSHRRAMATSSPQAFGRLYLRDHFARQSSAMHADFFRTFMEATEARNARVAFAAPRGHAKSTVISLSCVLWTLVTEREKFVWLVSATQDQAQTLLRAIREELESNDLLREDFPKVCVPRPGPKPSPWRGHHLSLPNGTAVRCLGLDQQVRGLRHKSSRPSLIVLDDAEHHEHVKSEEQRIKSREIFERTILKAGDERTNVFVIGTVLHHDSLLSRLLDEDLSPGWKTRKYTAVSRWPANMDLWDRWESVYASRTTWQGGSGPEAASAFLAAHREAMREGAEVLWPENWSLEALMLMRLREGQSSFASEMMNDPIDPAECLFTAFDFTYWDDTHETFEQLVRYSSDRAGCLIACDPSMGRKGRGGDYSAIIVLLYDPMKEVRYVVEADIARRSPDATIERIVELAQAYQAKVCIMESNGFQGMMADNLLRRLDERRIKLPIGEVSSVGDKKGRIESLEPQMRQGVLQLSRKHRLLLGQLLQFPLGKHDDGPDALELAVRTSVVKISGMDLFGVRIEQTRWGAAEGVRFRRPGNRSAG